MHEAAHTFSITNHEALQSDVSEIDLQKMPDGATNALSQLNGYALESDCPKPKVIGKDRLGCQVVGSAIAYERLFIAFEEHIIGSGETRPEEQ